jgi:4-aminobutyrate aminotransferase
VHFVPAPTCGDCPLKLAYPACGLACADAVGEVPARHPGEIAALIAEPVQGNDGINVPPPGYFERVQAHLREHGALLVMDEAQTGFCRTGRRFGHQHWNVQPDMITVCKALANGLPIAGLVATRAVAAAYTKPGASTFGGNLVCASAALATLDFVREHRLEQAAEAAGRRLRAGLDALALRHPCVKAVRGLGLMLGIELIDAAGEPAGALLDDILEAVKDRGVLAGKTGPGRNVLTLMPPLVITNEQIDVVLTTLNAVFDLLAAGAEAPA